VEIVGELHFCCGGNEVEQVQWSSWWNEFVFMFALFGVLAELMIGAAIGQRRVGEGCD